MQGMAGGIELLQTSNQANAWIDRDFSSFSCGCVGDVVQAAVFFFGGGHQRRQKGCYTTIPKKIMQGVSTSSQR
jgi:hypothetical protein